MTRQPATGALDAESYARLRRAAGTTRKRLLVRLCGEAGLRPAELTRLRPDDVAATVHEGRAHYFVTIRDEDGEPLRETHLPRGLKRELDRYVADRGISDSAPAFEVSARRLQMLVGEAVETAAEEGADVSGVSTADLRRHCARSWLARGVRPAAVLSAGGWSRLDGLAAQPETIDRTTAAAAFAAANGGDDRVRAAFDRLDQPTLLLDEAGVVERANDQFEETVGVGAVGRELADVAAPADGRDYTAAWETTLAGGTWRGPVDCRTKGGEAVEGTLVLAAVDAAGGADGFVATLRSTPSAPNPHDRLPSVQSRLLAAGDALAGASTREGVFDRVCETLVAGDAYRGVSVFEAPFERAMPAATVGEADQPTDAAALAAAAVADDEVKTAEESAALAVPLTHDGTDHGALVIVPATATDGHERRALAAFGGRVAGTLAAVEWKRLLLADAVLELELQVSEVDSLFASASAALDCTLTVEGLVPLDGESLLYYVSVEDAATEETLTRVEDAAASARLIAAASDASLLEVTADGNSFPGAFIAQGANVTALRAAGGTVELTCETAPSADVRALVEGVRESYPGTRLLAKREVERAVRTPTEFQQALAERLTDKQRSVLQAAYHAGYFDWPRGSTAEELADSIGVSSPTLHNHLRRAQRKLLAAFFDGD
ncbi:bacterio-opsin activator domain-containing protein [Halosegnis sp.]|uniref:bacterio-opsin activator domain-containing protein n=1 Tax=Halosegnis sp. TaxID=2864959 RepID=UPI0035D45B15